MTSKVTSPPDLSEFKRANWNLNALDQAQFLALAGIATTGSRKALPQNIPVSVLDAMGWDEAVYWAEWLITSPSRAEALYYVQHDDPSVRAETDAWLRPLLADLLPPITRAFGYGAVPLILDWGVGDLEAQVVSADGKSKRKKTFKLHVHYSHVHDLWPGEAGIKVEDDRLLAIEGPDHREYGGLDLERLGQVRGYLAVWDKQFNRWKGQGSRRRAYDAWFDKGYHNLWSNRYIERSVDPVRVGYAPEGQITLSNGQTYEPVKLLTAIMQASRNGSSVVLPATLMKDSDLRAWAVENLSVPDRSQVWDKVLERDDARIMRATLAPFAGGKLDESIYFDHVQSVATFVAQCLSKVVATTHWMNHGVHSTPPTIKANDIPKAKKRILQEIFKNVSSAVQHTADGKQVYTLGELVHPEILDQLGVKARPVEEAAHEQSELAIGQPGRPLDLGSDREERRDDGRTDEGQNDTGGDDQDREERD